MRLMIICELDMLATEICGAEQYRMQASFSTGKRRSSRVRKGAPWLKITLITAAWAAVRVKHSYLLAQFHRLRARRGAKKAILAVASSMLTASYHMLKNGIEYLDLGAGHFARRDRGRMIQGLVRRTNDLGCQAQLTPAAA
jgi:transposase